MRFRKLILTAVAAAMALVPVRAQEPVAASAASVSDPVAQCVDSVAPAMSAASIVEKINAPGSTVIVELSPALAARLEKRADNPVETNEAETSEASEESQEATPERPVQISRGKIVGYRIQIYTDQNARTGKIEARNRERAVSRSFPQYATYLTYSSPYWRLRVGDFKTQEEATKAAASIRRAFPRYSRDVRIVRDRINSC